MTVGVTGVTGHLGSLLVQRLLADPGVASVVSVARRPVEASEPRWRHVRADLREPAARAALAGVDLCFHLGFQLWPGRDPAGMRDANLDGTANVVAARPAALVLASSAAVYGAWPDNPLPIAEDHRPRPNERCAYAGQKLTAERRCLDGARTVVVRLGAVLGSHADPAVARSVSGYRIAVPAMRGAGQAVQFVAEDDAVSALVAAGRALVAPPGPAAPDGLICNAATADWMSAEDIASASGGRVVHLPPGLLLAASEAARRARLLPFGADRAVLLSGPLAVDSTLAATALGWTATRSSREVLAAALASSPHRQAGRW